MNEKKSGLLALILSMFIFGTIGIFRRYIPLGSAALACARGLIGMLSLSALLLIRRERPCWADIRKYGGLLVLSGALIGINWILLFEAYNYTTVASATLCYYMAPIFVILVSPFVLGERLTAKKLLCAAAAIAGMVLVSGVLSGGETDLRGMLFGLGAAAFYASVILLNKKIVGMRAYDKTIVQLGAAAIVLLPYLLLVEGVGDISLTPIAIGMVLLVGVLHTGIAYALYFGSIGKLKAQTVALFSYIDPVTAVLLSAFLLGEKMGLMEVLGTVLILCAAIVSELPERSEKAG